MTFTVTAAQGGSVAAGMAVAVKVLTGAAATQNGATAGATNTSQNLFGIPLTPHASGSLVYGAFLGFPAVNWVPFDANTAPFLQDAHGAVEYIALKSAAVTTASAAVTLGASSPTVNGISLSLLEVLAAGTLAEDASAPPASGNVAATSFTTASFSPPAGSLLAVMVSANGGGGQATMTVTDTSGLGLTWAEQARQNVAGDGYAGIWTAEVPAAAGLLMGSFP